jgi:predicted CoA-binding protein
MKTVAVIGASNDRRKFGNKAVRAFLQQGYTVYPVNPTESEVEGITAYRRVSDLPERPDRVTVYVPPQVLLGLLPEIEKRGCDELWLNPGTESDEVLERAADLGLNAIQACSILGIGVSPHSL